MSIEYDIPTPRTNAARGFDTVVDMEEMAKLERELAVITLERDEAKFERETVEAESQQLRKQIDGNIEDYLNEKLCCNGHECGCGGVTRLQQYVMEEAATELSSLRAELTDAKERIASLKESFEFAREKRDVAEQQVMALRGALDCLLVGACAVAVPHAGERAVLQDAVDIARKALSAAPSAPAASPLPENTGELLMALHAEFYSGPKAHADAFRILPRVVAYIAAHSPIKL